MGDQTNEERIYEKTITLRLPVQLTVDGPITETLELKEPTAEQFEKMAKAAAANPAAALTQLIADVTGLPLPIIKKVTVSQWEEAGDFLMGFTKTGRKMETS
jgi:hypothetical protein